MDSSQSRADRSPRMEIELAGADTVRTLRSASEGEYHLRCPHPNPQTTEALNLPGGDQPVTFHQHLWVQDHDPTLVDMPEGPEQNTGGHGDGVDYSILGSNQSNPIWHLVYIAAFNLVFFIVAGVSFLSVYLSTVHPTYQKVMHIMIFGVPIALAVISLSISCWLACYPAERGNLITGLLVANYSMYGVHAGLLTLKYGTGN